MDLLDVMLAARGREVFGFKDGSVDEFAPIFTDLLLVNDTEILTHEFGIDGDYFDELVPKGEYLRADYIDVVN